MEAYDDISDDELEFLLALSRKKKIKRAIIIGAIALAVILFAVLCICSLMYEPPLADTEIVEQYPFP